MGKNNSNSKQAMWVALGSLASFCVSIITSMILSRHFDKVDYGTYKQVMYVYQTLLTIFTLGLPQAFGYFLPRVSREEGRDVVKKITTIFLVAGTLFSAFLFLAAPIIAQVLKNELLTDAIRLFSPVPFLLLPTMGIERIYSAYREAHISALYILISRLLVIAFVTIPVLCSDGDYKSAIIGFDIASAISFFVALYLKNYPFRNLSKKESDVTLHEILNFSIPLMFAGIWSLIIRSSDQFFVSRYFGAQAFAEFANGSMELPFVGMIISACSAVLYPMFSKMESEKLDPKRSVFPVWRSVFSKTALLIYPLVAFCFVYSKEIICVLYGETYEMSHIYFRIKLLVHPFTLIAYAPVILSIGKTQYYANVHLFGALILVALEMLSVQTLHDPIAIAVISVVCRIGRIFFMLRLISRHFGVSLIQLFPINLILKILTPALGTLFIIKYCLTDHFEYPTGLAMGLFLYAVIYFTYAHFSGIDYKSIIQPIFARK
ncbi:MAG: oligosaccharide flippase family protein [Paludibacteraceae bacterium]|nr:oligosaccharide flippase family protein [Paludibacteraceae bacterium]